MAAINVALRMWFAVVLVVTHLVSHPPQPSPLAAGPSNGVAPLAVDVQAVRISQVYGGTNTSPPYPCDFIELFNATAQPVSLAGWSVQYSSAASNIWSLNKLGGLTIAGYGYILVLGFCTGTRPATYDVAGSLYIGTTDGKVALAKAETSINGLTDPVVVDFVGYGAPNAYEGNGPAPKLSGTTSAWRGGGGCVDTDDNAADFVAGSVAPRSSKSPIHQCPETAPLVWGTSPKHGAINVALDTSITIDFSEAVDVGPNWFEIRCDLSGIRTASNATVAGGPLSYTIDPNENFLGDDACRMTIAASAVTDSDDSDPPDAMIADYIVEFRTVPGQCGDPAYKIHGVQGRGTESPAAGQVRTLEGVVTADFQGAAALSGYFLQEETADADGDAKTSEGLFVDEHSGTLRDVAAGDRVRVTGVISEVDGMTSLTGATRLLACPAQDPPEPAELSLPLASLDDWEQFEAMLVRFSDRLTVADSTDLASKGQLTLVHGQVPLLFTQQNEPDTSGHAAWANNLALRSVVLEDGSQLNYLDPIRYPPPALTAFNTVRAGDVLEPGLVGIVDGRSGGGRLQPTGPVNFIHQNERAPAPPRTSGNVRVAFLSLNDYFNVTNGPGGPRGASSPEEFIRQRDKLVAALTALNADVIAVSKLENNGFAVGGALADLTNALNAVTLPGTYAFVDPGLAAWGADAVSVAALYRAASVIPLGEPAILTTGAFNQESFAPMHRAPLAQTFEERTWGERFTVVANEWHDRTSCPTDGADADAADGQGCWNAARTAAAGDLTAWLAQDPTNSGDPDYLVLGELNALAHEQPIQQLLDSGYIDAIERHVGSSAITSLVDARAGYTTHALASHALAVQVADASVWAINAEEPAALDYQMENKSAAQLSSLYSPDPYRSADQNPVVVDLSLTPDQSDFGGNYGVAWHTGQGVWRLGQRWGGEDDGAARGPGDWNDGQGELVVAANGPAEQFACLYGWLDFSDGETQVGVTDAPDGNWDANENVITGVPLPVGRDQLVTFALPAGVLGPQTLNMRIRLVPAPDPLISACATASLAAPALLGPTGRADGGEVEDYAFEQVPLAVNIISFEAHSEDERIILSWETASEEDLAGFDLHRSRTSSGPWERVNATVIPANTPGAAHGGKYRYEDAACVEGSWWYRLSGIDLAGRTSELGLVETRVLAPTTLHLAYLRANSSSRWEGFLTLVLVGSAIAVIWHRRRRAISPRDSRR